MPVFGGSEGHEITKSFSDIQREFGKLVGTLALAADAALDVKATGWREEYNAFKVGVKDLEVQTTNVMVAAVDGAGSLNAMVEMIEALRSMAKTEAVRRCVERKITECYDAYAAELVAVKKMFDSQRELPPFPEYAEARGRGEVGDDTARAPEAAYDKLEEAATVFEKSRAREASGLVRAGAAAD